MRTNSNDSQLGVFPDDDDLVPTSEESKVIHINTSRALTPKVENALSLETQRHQVAFTPSLGRTLAKDGLQSARDAQTFHLDMWRAQQNLGSVQDFTIIAREETNSKVKHAPEAEQQLLAEEQIYLDAVKNMFRDSLRVRRVDDDR